MQNPIREDRIAEYLIFDPLAAAKVLSAIARAPHSVVSSAVLDDIRREEGLSSERLSSIVQALERVGLIKRGAGNTVGLGVNTSDIENHCSFLRGVAYAKYLHRDANQIQVTLSPPMHPSRLMSILPSVGFGWARLHDTKDALRSLALKATQRVVILSPFLDEYGLDWAIELFVAPQCEVARILVIRGLDPAHRKALELKQSALSSLGVRVYRYAIQHERSEREAVWESFHAKVILCDTDHAYIGSSNMNRASKDISLECGVTISGPAVRPVTTLVDSIIAVSAPLTSF